MFRMIIARTFVVVVALVTAVSTSQETVATGPQTGINVLLNQPSSQAILAELETYGQVLDTLPEINGVRLRADESTLGSIRALPYVESANPDELAELGSTTEVQQSDFADGV